MAETDTSLLETPSPENTVLNETTMQTAMGKLSERRREAVRLRIQEQLTHVEIGQILGISAIAAERLVFRASRGAAENPEGVRIILAGSY